MRRLPKLRRASDEDGFTLLELLIAFAILGVGLVTILAAFSQGLQRARDDRAEAEARGFAASLLSQTLVTPDAADTSGSSHGYSWQVSLAPFGDKDDVSAWQAQAREVRVTVQWADRGGTRQITLTSLRLVPAPAQ